MGTTSKRIQKAMELRGLKQTDLVEKTGISKGALSSYISGRYIPKQNNTFLIAKALNVNEAWLMGADVPMERDNYEDQNVLTYYALESDAEELLKQAGYQIINSESTDIVTITNSDQEIICALHEYELVGIYENLIKKGTVSAQALITQAASGWEKVDSYIYGKEASDEVYQKLAKNILRFQGKQKDLNEIYLQLSPDNQDRVLTYSQNLLSTQQMEEDVLAAHARTDVEQTSDGVQHDLDIMNDDSMWD